MRGTLAYAFFAHVSYRARGEYGYIGGYSEKVKIQAKKRVKRENDKGREKSDVSSGSLGPCSRASLEASTLLR